jgi:ABC-type amino acid transport/signal transduction systems, periplasmic component/domain
MALLRYEITRTGGGFIMKKLIALCVLVVMAGGVFAGCGSDSAKKADNTKKIVVGLDDNYPPMGFKDESNNIVGFDVDLAKEASKRLNREVEFKGIDWSSKEAELKSSRVDILWNGLDITEKRKENILFSDPYMDNRQIIFVPVGSSIKSMEDLKGKIVGTQSASTAEEFIDNNPEFRDSMKDVKKYSEYTSAFMDLENGRLEAIIADEITGRYYMSKQKDKFVALDVTVGPVSTFGIGFRKEDQQLRDDVQKVMNEMQQDGTMGKISEKWFGKDITKK